MDIDQIRELVQLMVDNDLSELDVTDGESKVRLKRGPSGEVVTVSAPPAASAQSAPAAGPPPEVEEGLVEIKSPMVGTFYSAPSPDSDAYVSVGSQVAEDTVVCIIEAMKVMNEIKAGCAGQIAEVCVKNGQPVEYGETIFMVRTA